MKSILSAAFLTLAMVCAGCSHMPARQAGIAKPVSTPLPPPDPKTQMAALEKRIEELIETRRKEINPAAKVLAEDPELVDIARKRSADMAEKSYLAGATPDGGTSASMLMAADEQFQGLLGENIAAQNYNAQTGVDVETFAERFVESWMDSPRHKENLSFPDYDHTGVGAAVNGQTVYVTQLFSTDLGMGKYDPKKQPARPFVSLPSPAAAKENTPAPAARPVTLRGSQDTQPRP